ncbi:MAG: hypothetical protein COA78_22075 [Blastopirellula sp.]|nr:MAG: hypothetical protein COA78_22075 [Blastopirellula sp.]
MTNLNETAKFRQWVKIVGEGMGYHYFGWINEGWVSPISFKGKFEQFTGLTDKNKNDIYENDIVSVDDLSNGIWFGCPQPQKISEVWICPEYGVRPRGVKKGEIIGNIHQNGELLNND